MSKNSINCNQELRMGEFLLSLNGEYKAIFQEDSNFVIYKWSPIWASNTCNGGGDRLLLQTDSNLVIYTHCDKPIWASGTCNSKQSEKIRLTLTNEGVLQVDIDGKKVWASK